MNSKTALRFESDFERTVIGFGCAFVAPALLLDPLLNDCDRLDGGGGGNFGVAEVAPLLSKPTALSRAQGSSALPIVLVLKARPLMSYCV